MLTQLLTRPSASRRDRAAHASTATATLLLRHTTADGRPRDEKGLERLRAWCPICREPSGLLPTRQWSPRTGLTLRPSWEPSPLGASIVVLAGRATRVP